MNQPRVLTVICAPDWGGLHAVVERTTPFICEQGFQRTVILPVSQPGIRERLEAAGCTVIHRNFVRPRRSASLALWWRFLRGFASDVSVIAAMAREHQVSLIEACGLHHLQPVAAARKLGLPLIWQLHGTSAPRVMRCLIGRLAARWADVVMTSGKGMIARHGGLKQIADRVVPFCAPLDLRKFYPDPAIRRQIRSDWGYTEQDVVIGTLGNRGRVKNQGMIVEVARRLRCESLPLKFAICGNAVRGNAGYFESRVNKPIREQGLFRGDYVKVFAQMVSPETIMNAFDVFLLTSRGEGASLVTAEALASGLPVVATDVGSLRDLVQEGENGMLVGINEVEKAAAALRRLADPGLRARMGRRSREIAITSVSAGRCAAAHVEAYRHALGTRLDKTHGQNGTHAIAQQSSIHSPQNDGAMPPREEVETC